MKQQVWDVEALRSLPRVSPLVRHYCGRFDTFDFCFAPPMNLSGFISVVIGFMHTAKM